MDLCKLVPRLYVLSQRALFRMNESDRQQNRINCMDELYGCNSVNSWIDYMNLSDRDWWEWKNWRWKHIISWTRENRKRTVRSYGLVRRNEWMDWEENYRRNGQIGSIDKAYILTCQNKTINKLTVYNNNITSHKHL